MPLDEASGDTGACYSSLYTCWHRRDVTRRIPDAHMASLVNRNGTFYVCWTDTDRVPSQRRLSLRTRDKGLARILMGKADAAYRMGQFDPWLDGLEALDPTRPKTSVSLTDAQGRYLAARADDLRPLTIKRYLVVFKGLGKHLKQNTTVARVKPSDLAPYVLDPKAKPNTQRCRRTLLRAFFAWCEREGLAPSNPAATLRQPKHDSGKSIINRRVTEEELERICAEVEKDHERRMSLGNRHVGAPRLWLTRVFRFAYYTGLRGGELARLQWDDVNLPGRALTIQEQKNGQVTVLPLSRAATRVLESIPDEERRSPFVFRNPIQRREVTELRQFAGNLNNYFVEYREAAGIGRPVTLHGLRHGFASRLAEAGASAWTVKEACRHSTVTVSQTYVTIANKALAEELDAVFG